MSLLNSLLYPIIKLKSTIKSIYLICSASCYLLPQFKCLPLVSPHLCIFPEVFIFLCKANTIQATPTDHTTAACRAGGCSNERHCWAGIPTLGTEAQLVVWSKRTLRLCLSPSWHFCHLVLASYVLLFLPSTALPSLLKLFVTQSSCTPNPDLDWCSPLGTHFLK